MIQDVNADNVFWLFGGKPIKNMLELGRELRQMSTEAFAHHVKSDKNDFATWAEYSLKDHHLATLLRTTKDQSRMAAIVERRIQEFTRPPEKPAHHAEIKKQMHHHSPEKQMPRRHQTPSEHHTPTIIKTRHVTPLLAVTKEQLQQVEQVKKEVVHTPFKTHLKLTHEDPPTEIYVHEVKKPHAAASLLIAHVLLGLVVGIGIIMVIIA